MFDEYSIIAIVPLVVVLVLGLRATKPQPVAQAPEVDTEAITQPLAPRVMIVAEVKPLEPSIAEMLLAQWQAKAQAYEQLQAGQPVTGPTIKLPELPASMVSFLENLE